MRWILCVTMLAALGFAPAPVYRPKAGEKDVDLLQGKWLFVSSEDDGMPAKHEKGDCIVVQGSDFELHPKGGPPVRYRVVLDETKQGRTLELREVGQPDSEKKSYRGFYKLTGDELIFCIGSSRDEAAASIEGGKGMERYVLKRSPKP